MVFSTSASASASAHPLFSSSDPSIWNQQPPHVQDQPGSNDHHHLSGATGNSENTYIGIQLPAVPDHFALASSSSTGGGLLIAPIPTDPNITSLNKPPIAEPGGLKCPRCDSTNTKFCYFNNYSLSQPRHFCRACRRYWTRGGTLRNVPVGGGSRRNSKHSKVNSAISKPARASSSKALSNSTRRIGIPSSNYNLTASTNVRPSGGTEMPMQLIKQPPQFPFIIGSPGSSHPMGTENGHLLGLNSRYDELLCGSNGTAGGSVVTGMGSNNNNSEFQSSLPSSMNYSNSHGNIFP